MVVDELEQVEVLGIVVEVVPVVPVVVVCVVVLVVVPVLDWTVSVVVDEILSTTLTLRRRRYRTGAAAVIASAVPVEDVLSVVVPLVV